MDRGGGRSSLRACVGVALVFKSSSLSLSAGLGDEFALSRSARRDFTFLRGDGGKESREARTVFFGINCGLIARR